ncbi:fluoride efflux transporter CrcB [Clostridium estertheticum]|uniref:Fluoride-specific ion channel FluC n=1 Tax=Clostridium estertheticum subsp. estertheticum TaxID=1552 RepID=A0A1J0GKR6_9CLOT|nr:fluoride efflux transporter CrcB [Clostridium estertheticum]APC41486.1 camphor resistance protein CrcB [Clostridium estertheticum subsp. estertheticum]MBU3072799.1 fluoride efflux transporter CrcB [Clostridium estertheticum]MBU3163164.1 fluoride efflux transporter CrcB [Clostridium estertheticum]MBZ9616605.1 fluoride efflux transporter CrcB [Clostridium estertheticum subsp. laramiense]WAG72328.1 fluoride efflux transporter CrcB [Clostridium estertheticum]
MTYVLVAVGGAAGSLVRYSLGKFISEKSKHSFPIGTFIINITGALLLGIVSTIGVSSNIALLLGDGFLGAYTTFSTFMYEGFNLFKEKEKLNAFIYILCTLILGVVGYVIGSKIGRL